MTKQDLIKKYSAMKLTEDFYNMLMRDLNNLVESALVSTNCTSGITDPETLEHTVEALHGIYVPGKDELCTCEEPPFRGFCTIHDENTEGRV